MTLPDEDLGVRWRAARVPVVGIHLDHAACSRQSDRVLAAVAEHARIEAEVGGYVAEEAAAPLIDAGRAAAAALLGMAAGDVMYVESAELALARLLMHWPLPDGAVVAALPGEYGPNLAAFEARGLTFTPLPVDDLGRADVDGVEALLRRQPPAFVHLTVVGSHRGVVQPGADVARLCRDAEVPLVVDAAQGLGHVDLRFDADAMYAPSRKWLAGPRGVAVLGIRPSLAEKLTAPNGLEARESHVAGRVGLALALHEHLATGPARIRARLAAIGVLTRDVLDGVGGWRVVETRDEPTAITTLVPPDGVDVGATRARLLEEARILTTHAATERAPRELTAPALRVSPHLDVTTDDLVHLGRALAMGHL